MAGAPLVCSHLPTPSVLRPGESQTCGLSASPALLREAQTKAAPFPRGCGPHCPGLGSASSVFP